VRRRFSSFVIVVSFLGVLSGVAQEPKPKADSQPAKSSKSDTATPAPTKPALKEPQATDPAKLKTISGFKVELIYSVPKDKQGSWVNMCVDPRGRLIVCDQYGGLFRVTPPKIGEPPSKTLVEPLDLPIGEAQGMVWAFDSLYVVANRHQKYDSGLYRLRDTNHDDLLDQVELLRKLDGAGEHGPHAVIAHPDGKHLVVVCGNATRLTNFAATRVPPVWGEDHLLPRMPDGRGFMKGVLGPGGAIYITDPDGKDWELFSVGFRNQYDAAFNRDGELFTYDADMEWDFNTPWYRPTRVCHVTSGSEFGWRNGAGKWPPHYPDSVPPVVNIGPGSPTGVCFGYGSRFPKKYQDALYICDWSYGKLYAVFLSPKGSGYRADFEEFIIGSPLPLTDVVINPLDGAMYFTIGGRKTKSGLYRVTYVGPSSPEPALPQNPEAAELRKLRHQLESYHGKKDPAAVEVIWPHLDHPDRLIRYAARTALEHQEVTRWLERAINEEDSGKAIAAMLALVRVAAHDPQHHPTAPKPSPELKNLILERLTRFPWERLTDTQRLDLLRVYAIFFNRFGSPDQQQRQAVLDQLSRHFPTGHRLLDPDLCQVFVYLQDPTIAARAVPFVHDAPTQEEQMEYARHLRMLKAGWNPELRKRYLEWFVKAANYKGGMSFRGFVEQIKADAVQNLTPAERDQFASILNAKPADGKPIQVKQRPFVKKYTLEELSPIVERGLHGRDYDRGRRLFGEANCFACHRFDNEGGAHGPDLTGVAGRFSPRDLLESILEPSKVISDQYGAVVIETIDGKQIQGRIVNHGDDNLMIMPNMLDPSNVIAVDRKKIESLTESKVSMMPDGLLDTMNVEEILDLLAYLLSRGDRHHEMFKR
jgi:putative heme-binding domain-containing protein